MHVVDGLYEDHDKILEALALLEEAVRRLESDRDVARTVSELLEFLSKFADQRHHGKEELLLFPELEKRGVPLHGDPIGVMVCEHGMGRYMLRNAAKALERVAKGDRDALSLLKHYVESYTSLLREHIEKENNVLFQMARELIAEGELVAEARAIEEQVGHEELLKRLESLKASLR
ncbi:MAG: hemerythrin domain-containing protein [Thermoproteota archaeon]